MRTLAFGLTGGVGRVLQPRLGLRGWPVLAITRRPPPPDTPLLRWRRDALPTLTLPAEDFDLVLSLGPLDRFVEWLANSSRQPARIVALGSMSVEAKRDSSDPAERAQARALAEAETRLFELGRARGMVVTVLRPTLVYGTGDEASLAPLVQLARRWGVCPFPTGATGLRQPVHVEDIASAVLACASSADAGGRAYALPGGEQLPLVEMVRRTLAARAPQARLLPVPAGAWALAVRVAGSRSAQGSVAGFLARRRFDQCADPGPAQRDFGYLPGPFRP